MRHVLSILILSYSIVAHSQTFQKAYGGLDNEFGKSGISTSDGGFLMAGYTRTYGVGMSDFYLLKTNGAGDVSWSRTFGGSNADFGISVKEVPSGFIFCGYTNTFGAGGADIWLIKTGTTGAFSWSRVIGGSADDKSWEVNETSDGGYVIAGYTSSFGAGSHDFYLIKTDVSGNIAWARTYGGPNSEMAYTAKQTSDGGYIIAGKTQSFGAGNTDGYIVKTNALGDTLWTRVYGGSNDDWFNSVIQLSSGEYILTGYTASYGAGGTDALMMKLNSIGDVIWSNAYGGAGTEYGNYARECIEGGLIMLAYSETFSPAPGSKGPLMIRTDLNGDTLWVKNYGGSGQEIGYTVEQTPDTGYIITGQTQSYGAGGSDVFAIKTNAQGGCGCNEFDVSPEVNPAPLTKNHGGAVGNTVNSSIIVPASGTGVPIVDVQCFNCISYNVTENNPTCFAGNDGSASVFPNGGTAPYSYLWSTGGTSNLVTGLGAGTYDCTITDGSGCQTIATINIIDPPPLAVTITGDTSICYGDTATITASGGTDYLWNNGSSDSTISVSLTGTMTFTVIVTLGTCSYARDVEILVTPNPLAQISGDSLICTGTIVTLKGSGIGNFEWNTGDITNDLTVTPMVDTEYILEASNACGMDRDTFFIRVNANPFAEGGEDTTITIGQSVQLHGTGGVSYVWYPTIGLDCGNIGPFIPCTDPIASPTKTTTYRLTVTDAYGCKASDTFTIEVLVCEDVALAIPQAFSPNGDGNNDLLYVRGSGFELENYAIYNRYAQMVYQSMDINEGWDGTFHGKPEDPGVFIYHVKWHCKFTQETQVTKGNVTLMR